MCLPAIAGAAISIGSTLQQTAQAQANFTANAEAAAKQSAYQILQNRVEDRQALDAARVSALERTRAKLAEQGFVTAAAAAAGTVGGSIERQLAGASIDAELDRDTIRANAENVAQQNAIENSAAVENARQAGKNPPKVNVLQLGVAGAGGALQGYQIGKALGA